MTRSMAAWLAADPAVPQRDALLDTRHVAGRIASLLGRGRTLTIDRCDRLRVNYRIGKSLRVLYHLVADGAPLTVSARAYRSGRAQQAYREALASSGTSPSEPAVLYDAALHTVFWVFPNDRKLPNLASIAGGRLRAADTPPLWTSSRVMAYAPEKSVTFECAAGDGRIVGYAKVAAAERTVCDYDLYTALSAQSNTDRHVRVPRALACFPRHRTLLLEPIEGRRMPEPGSATDAPLAFRLGAAIAAFHGFEAAHPPAFTRFAADRLLEVRRLISCVRPDVAPATARVLDALMTRRPEADGAPVTLHGDVHPKNAIAIDRAVALIDVEDLAFGPAAADVGSFLAALAYLRCGGRLSRAAHSAIAAAFLRGYGTVRPIPEHRTLRWHVAAALLVERALRAVTRVRPLGLLHLERVLETATATVTETDHEIVPRSLS